MPSSTLGQNKKITLIATHENADFDGLASIVAAGRLYPNAILIAPNSQERGVREFMLSTAMDYFQLFQLKDINPKQVEKVVLVDTSQLSRIGPLAEIVKREGVEVHIYDHHPPSEDDILAKVSIVKPVGATVTILTHILREKEICPSPEEATLMALGLYEDTGSFTFRSTTKEDLEAAAYLIGCGANLNVVTELITRRLGAEEVDLLNKLIHGAHTHFIHDVPVVISRLSVEQYIRDFAALVNRFIEIEKMPVVFTLVRMENRIFIVARSRLPEVNVAEILSVFDGGGHPAAASAVVKNLTLIQVEHKLLATLSKKVTTLKVAKDLMSYPVKSISQDTKIKEAEAIFVHYDVNALPVTDDNKLVGIITRPVVDKAMFHGLKDRSVKRFMTTEFPTLPPNAPLTKIKKALLQHKQRSLPIIEHGKLVGIITRKDLLHYLLTSPSSFFEHLESKKRPRQKFITSLIHERLPRKIIDLLKKIGEIGDSVGYSVYAVGGFIRDLLLRQKNLDIDIVVEGDAILLAKKLSKNLGARVHSHPKFGTAVVVFSDGFCIDIATARTEFYETPGALPTVEMSSLKLDLYRRDFTINTLAVKLNPKQFGLLMDFFGAQQDIKQGVISILHNLSFVEDPTRVLRAVRFEQRFDFKIGKHTLNLIYQAEQLNLLEHVSGARIWHELKLILEEANPPAILKRLHALKALKFLHPSIVWNEKLEDLFKEIKTVFSWFDLLYLKKSYDKSLVYLLGLVDNLNKDLSVFLDKLEFSEGLKKRILEKRYLILEIYNKWQVAPSILPSQIYFTLKDLPTEYLLYLMAKMPEEKKKCISDYFVKLKDVETILTGEDLKAMGFRPGPIFKKILESLLKAKLDGIVKTRADEEQFVFEKFWDKR